ELRPAANRPAAATTPSAAPPLTSGTWALSRRLLALRRAQTSLSDLADSTIALTRSVDTELGAITASVRAGFAQLRTMAKDPAPGGDSIADSERHFNALLAQVKGLSAAVLPLRSKSALLHRYLTEIDETRRSVNRTSLQLLEGLALDLLGLCVIIAAVLVGGS